MSIANIFTNFQIIYFKEKGKLKMLEMVQYLLNSPDVLVKVKEGTASLIGVNEDQLKAIMDAFSGENISPKIRYWK